MNYCVTNPGEQEAGLRIACDLWLYWGARGHLSEGRRLVEALLAACPHNSSERARGLAVAGFLALGATDPDAAVPLLQEALALAEAGNQPFAAALATQYLGQAALFLGELPRADQLLRRAAARYREVDPRHSAFCLADVGVAALFAGSLETAEQALHESLNLNEGGDPWTRSHALWALGLVRLHADDAAEAGRLEQSALRLMREVDDRSGVARCVDAISWAAAAQRDSDRAALLSGAADAIWRSIPAVPPVPLTGYRDRYLARARRTVGEHRWSARHREGTGLDRGEAVSLALGEAAPELPRMVPPQASALTKRQREVAVLVAQGLTDREIAEQLVISPRTAESHVEQILARLGFRSRAEIAAWTATHE